MTYEIHNRRYIGNKYKLLYFIDDVLKKENIQFSSVADIFSGTGVVAEYFLSQKKNVIINDILYSNYVFYKAWLSNLPYDSRKITKYINFYNEENSYISDNYFSDTFSGTYFSYEDAKKIGSIRQDLEKQKDNFSEREFYILLSSLLYTTDRIANTVGHFEAFLGNSPIMKGVVLEELSIHKYQSNVDIYQQDANSLTKQIKADLFYLDPPYNARQYINFYHVLENLAEWKKPEVFGKTLKMERNNKKSVYSQSKAKIALEQLVKDIRAKYILLSYNNTYSANSGASINKISEQEIIGILEQVGDVKKYDTSYNFFNSGKTNFSDHRECLYWCEVKLSVD